jgi:hypothetical protein
LNIVNNGLDTNGGGISTISLAILTPKPIFGLVRECADRVQRKNRQASAQRPERQKTEEEMSIKTDIPSGMIISRSHWADRSLNMRIPYVLRYKIINR